MPVCCGGCRKCSTAVDSTSLWTLGTLARSAAFRCADALRLSQGSCTHTAAQGSGHKPCACAGAAQSMFYSASSFNQPLAAWDVGQVTNMQVRHRPVSWSRSQGSCAHSSAQGSGHNRVRVLAPRSICSTPQAPSTSLWKLGTSARSAPCRCAPAHTQLLRTAAKQPARVLVWSSICSPPRAPSTSPWKHGMLARSRPCMCAAALRQGHRAPAHTHAALGATSRVCVCWRGAGDVLLRKRFQPACGCLEC